MELLNAIRECLCLPFDEFRPTSGYTAEIAPDQEEMRIIDQVFEAMKEAEKTGEELRVKVTNVIRVNSWTESLAKKLLERLDDGIKKGILMSGPLKDAFEKALVAAVDFPEEHPVYTTIIALGILVVLLPWVIEALGFAELGPVEGSFAALWQSRYLGYVPKGSLFSYFQRLGMIWKHAAVTTWSFVMAERMVKSKI